MAANPQGRCKVVGQILVEQQLHSRSPATTSISLARSRTAVTAPASRKEIAKENNPPFARVSMHQTATALAPACLQSRSYRPEHPGRSKWRRCVSCPDYTLPARCRVRAWESRPEAPRRTEETHLPVGSVLSLDLRASAAPRELGIATACGSWPWSAITAGPKASSKSPSPRNNLAPTWPSRGSRQPVGLCAVPSLTPSCHGTCPAPSPGAGAAR